MRAVIVREPGPLAQHRLETVPDPAPARGEVLIEARAFGVNFPDVMVMQGSYQFLPPRPFSPGKEVAGVVGAVGAGVGLAHDAQASDAGRSRQRVGVECARMLHLRLAGPKLQGRHQIGTPGHAAARQTACENLRQRRQIRRDSVIPLGPARRDAEAGDDLIENQHAI